jgi:hypothetical protein
MGYDVLVAVTVVIAVLMVRTAPRAVRLVRRLRRQMLAALDRTRRGDAVVTDARWWTNLRDRRRMWHSIAAADRAVSAARAAGVPTGDLPSVVRQLRSAATVVDAGLAAPRRSPELLLQADALAAAADDVARAAADAVATDTAPLIARAVDAVRLELAALR